MQTHPVTRKPDSAWSYIWYGLKFILTIYIIYMLRRRNLTSSYLRNRGASRHRMRSPNFQSAKPFLTLLNNVKVLQAKLIFEEKINLSYIHIKIKVWRYPYLSQLFPQVIKKRLYQSISLLTMVFFRLWSSSNQNAQAANGIYGQGASNHWTCSNLF